MLRGLGHRAQGLGFRVHLQCVSMWTLSEHYVNTM